MNIAFYSYKGGVGRTLLLANCGYILSSFGLRVLLIDFDLEAPSLETYLGLTGENGGLLNPKELARKEGALELFDQIATDMVSSLNNFEAEYLKPLANGTFAPREDWLEKYVVQATLGDDCIIKGGTLSLLKPTSISANSEHYAERIRDFSWKEFREHWYGEDILRIVQKGLLEAFDVVLIDTRTGFTEVGSLVWQKLADAFVMVMAPNLDNLRGTEAAINFFHSGSKPKPGWIVPSRVPQDLAKALSGNQGISTQLPNPLSDRQEQWLKQVREFAENIRTKTSQRSINIREELAIWHNSEAAGAETLFSRKSLNRYAIKLNKSGRVSKVSEKQPSTSAARDATTESASVRKHDREQKTESELNLESQRLSGDGGFADEITGICVHLLDEIVKKLSKEREKRKTESKARIKSAIKLLGNFKKSFPLYSQQESTPPETRRTFREDQQTKACPLVIYCSESWSEVLRSGLGENTENVIICSLPVKEDSVIPVVARVEIWLFPFDNSHSDNEELAFRQALAILQRVRDLDPVIRASISCGSWEGFERLLSFASQRAPDGKLQSLTFQKNFHINRLLSTEKEVAEFITGELCPMILKDPLVALLGLDAGFVRSAPDLNSAEVDVLIESFNKQLDFENTTGSAEKWWQSVCTDFANRKLILLRLMEELAKRKATISEFFLSYVYSNTDNLQANLCYLDYTRLKKKEEQERKRAAQLKQQEKDAASPNDGADIAASS